MLNIRQEMVVDGGSFALAQSNGQSIDLPLSQVGHGEGWIETVHSDVIEGYSEDELAVLGRAVVTITQAPEERTDENVARADYLRSSILSIVVPKLTGGNVTTPEPLGYTFISGHGFAQVIERMDTTHSARLDDDGAENDKIREARELLWSQAESTGIQTLAHIHPENPVGKANFRVRSDGGLVWLDGRTELPVVSFPGSLLLPKFKFFKDAKATFGLDGKDQTFRKIDTEKLKDIAENLDLADEDRGKLNKLLQEYATEQAVIESADEKPKRVKVADSLEDLNSVTPRKADIIRSSDFGHNAIRLSIFGGAIVDLASEKIQSRASKLRDLPYVTYLCLKDPDIRTHVVLRNTILKGMSVATKNGTVSEKEYKEALDVVSPHDLNTYTALQIFYLANSRVFDALTASALTVYNSPKEVVGVLATGAIATSAVRGAVTALTDRFNKTDLSKATLCSLIPILGGYTAVAQQMWKTYGDYTKHIGHNNSRLAVAKLSGLRIGGGWGSDAEEKLWNDVVRAKAKIISSYNCATKQICKIIKRK